MPAGCASESHIGIMTCCQPAVSADNGQAEEEDILKDVH